MRPVADLEPQRGAGRTRPCPTGWSRIVAAQANRAAVARWRSARWPPGCGTSASTCARADRGAARPAPCASGSCAAPRPPRPAASARRAPARTPRNRRRRRRRRRRAPPRSGCMTASRNQRSWLTTTSACRPQPRQMTRQPADHLDVEVVGRLVEHQHVVAGEQHRGQRHPAPLTAAQIGDLRCRGRPRPAGARPPAGIRFGGPDVVGPAADDDVADARSRRRSRRSGAGSRPTARTVWVTRPESGSGLAGQHLQQRGLAVAVAPDDADRVAFVDTQADRVRAACGCRSRRSRARR